MPPSSPRSLRPGLRLRHEVRGVGAWEDGPRGWPHLLSLTLLQRPQRRVVEPEQQKAGPGRGREAEPEFPTQRLLGSRHAREVEGKQNRSHRRGPPALPSPCRAGLAQPGAQVGPAPGGPAPAPPTARSAPEVSRPREPRRFCLVWRAPLWACGRGFSQFREEVCVQLQTPHPENLQDCLSFPPQAT